MEQFLEGVANGDQSAHTLRSATWQQRALQLAATWQQRGLQLFHHLNRTYPQVVLYAPAAVLLLVILVVVVFSKGKKAEVASSLDPEDTVSARVKEVKEAKDKVPPPSATVFSGKARKNK